jgi:predicted molibdopterin-dependent oxidoreductase YjgC
MVLGAQLANGSTNTTTVCPFCGGGCTVLLEDGAAFPSASDPVTRSGLCLRGWSSGELLRSPLRILRARARSRGDPKPATPSDVALIEVAERLKGIRDRHGAEALGVLASARITLEENQLIRRLASAIGTPHLDSFQRLGAVGAPGLAVADLDAARGIIVVGADVAARHPQVGRRLLEASARGATVRFISPRRLQLSELAGRHVACLPGREVEVATSLRRGEFVIWSSELALGGRGGPAARAFGGAGTAFLPDYVNQGALGMAGIGPGPGGLGAYGMLRAAAQGQLRALLIFADDPFEFFPALAARAFGRLELVVVVDAVATRTTEAADVILPGALLSEKEGTVLRSDGSTRLLQQVWQPPARSTEGSVANVLCELFDADADASFGAPFRPSGPDGPAPDSSTDRFPFLAALDSGTLWQNHALVRATVTAWREARGPLADFPGGWVSLAADDARALGVRTGAAVRLVSDSGALTLAARVDTRILNGTLGIPMSAWERAGEALGALALDPALRIPIFRPRAVRLERAGEA